MFTKILSFAFLAVSAKGFAPIAPNFAARSITETSTSLGYTVTLTSDKEGWVDQTVECPPSVFILDAAEQQGVQTPYSCRAGACSSCAGVLIDGEIDQSGNLFLDDKKVEQGWMLTCVAYPKSDCTIKIDCEDEFYQS
mmetsp:Transcript_5710/g.13710  ORF Transcript_5710/g.13710 Transcript_5710/m.13710 type:complete len:138 (+) Transcript_5710:118-531(+)